MLAGLLMLINTAQTTNLLALQDFTFDLSEQRLLWLLFFISFAVKIPIVPLHIWLPEAHVQAPTSGSVLLAGILLKLGFYGILRFSFTLFPEATTYFTPLVFTIAILSVLLASATTLRQIDIKRIIAYSSVVHMNFALFGLFSNTLEGLQGAVYVLLSHGIVSGGLFLAVGVLYDRYHNRLLPYFSGLVLTMPLFTTFFFIFSISNLALPGTSSFVGELLILLGGVQQNMPIMFLGVFSLILGTAFSL